MSRAMILLGLLAIPVVAWVLHGALAREERGIAPVPVALREVVLPDGSRLQVPERAVRVLPANASALDFAARLIERGRIAGVPRAGFDYSLIAEEPEAWRALPTIGAFESEEILALAPDLVLTHTNQDRATVRNLRASGVVVFDVPVVTDWEGLLGAIRVVGLVLGEEPAAEDLVRDLTERRAAIDAGPAKGLSVLPYGNYGGTGFTAGAGTTRGLMIELAGMRNAAAEAGLANDTGIDFEQILVIDPDFIVVGGARRSGQSPTAAVLGAEPSLARLRALEDERILVLSDDLYSTASHRLLAAAEELARQARQTLESHGER